MDEKGNKMTSFTDVMTYISDAATADEVRQIFAAGNTRTAALRQRTAATLAVELQAGDAVELQGLRPKYLNGLTGTFVRLAGNGKAVVKLDKVSQLQAGPRYVSASGEITSSLSALRRMTGIDSLRELLP